MNKARKHPLSGKAVIVWILLAASSIDVAVAAQRDDFTVETADGLTIFVRQLTDDGAPADRGPFLLLNGGRPGVLASWDVDVPGPSVAALLAGAGHTVYLMDARGFGRSEFTAEMGDGREDGPVAVRSREVVHDIAAVVDHIRSRHGEEATLSATGWATGSQWLGHYASLYPGEIANLIYYQGAYGGEPGGWRFQGIADPGDPTRLDRERFPAFRCSTAEQVTGRLSEETNDAAFLERYAELALEGDERTGEREPPCFRFPSGPLADTLQMVNGRRVFDASSIEARTLILRSEHDFWSRPEDVRALRADLTTAAAVEYQELKGASHYVHLLPDGRDAFIEAILEFTAAAGG